VEDRHVIEVPESLPGGRFEERVSKGRDDRDRDDLDRDNHWFYQSTLTDQLSPRTRVGLAAGLDRTGPSSGKGL